MKYFLFVFVFLLSQYAGSQGLTWKTSSGKKVEIGSQSVTKGKWATQVRKKRVIRRHKRPSSSQTGTKANAKENVSAESSYVLVSGAKVFEVVDVQPSFPGGIDKMMAWLSRNLKYPASAQENGIQGRVIVQFVVDREGYICEPKVIKSVSRELDAEVIRVVSMMPRWSPGYVNGRRVRVRFTMPVTFRLN